MLTPPGITVWFDHWFAKKAALLDLLAEPEVDPLDGLTPNPDNALQGLCDMRAAMLGNPPTGNEPDPVLYQARYDALVAAIEYIRRFAAGGANGGQGYGQ